MTYNKFLSLISLIPNAQKEKRAFSCVDYDAFTKVISNIESLLNKDKSFFSFFDYSRCLFFLKYKNTLNHSSFYISDKIGNRCFGILVDPSHSLFSFIDISLKDLMDSSYLLDFEYLTPLSFSYFSSHFREVYSIPSFKQIVDAAY